MQDKTQWNGHCGLVLDDVKGFQVIECEICGFKHIVPIPTEDELEVAYREYYYTKKSPCI